jgi:tRNA-2-methylthio-N6-dimethylallyladenosine synthase
MNASDGERIATVLEGLNYKPASNEKEADLIVVNMCSVRQAAVDRIYGKANDFLKIKRKKPKLKTILTGCILSSDRKKFEKRFDLVLNIKDLPNWQKKMKFQESFGLKDYLRIKPKHKNKFSVLVPISNGCDNFCSYCAVPFTRGRLLCRSHKDIIKEIKDAIRKGIKEIWLLGQNVNNYKSPSDASIDFSKLLEMINKIPGSFWVRFTSPHPKDFSDKLVKVMAKCAKVTPYLNLPLQSGDNTILKKMNRPYTASEYEGLIKKIRKEMPDIAISTDIIVGFGGETKKQFENTKKLFQKIGFDMAYIGKYSKRPGTQAEKMEDSVPKKEKERRWSVLNEILKKTALKNNKKCVGKIIETLPEATDNGFLVGKTANYKTIRFKGSENLIGKFLKVKVTKALIWGLEGKIYE